jgi:hypothetical protein
VSKCLIFFFLVIRWFPYIHDSIGFCEEKVESCRHVKCLSFVFIYAPANFHLPVFLLLPSVLCLPITHTSSLMCVVPTVMVQLFNVPKIALIEEQHLLENFISVFKRVLEICLVRYPLRLLSLSVLASGLSIC